MPPPRTSGLFPVTDLRVIETPMSGAQNSCMDIAPRFSVSIGAEEIDIDCQPLRKAKDGRTHKRVLTDSKNR